MPEVKLEEGTFDARDWRASGDGWRERLQSERERLRRQLDTRLYEREDLKWYYTAYLQYFLFIYDTQFYDRASGRYLVEEVLDRGSNDFGGFVRDADRVGQFGDERSQKRSQIGGLGVEGVDCRPTLLF